jgi:N-acetylneuraminate synthase
MNQTIKIGDRLVGDGQPCFIIAEAGVNHNGDLDLAYKLIDKAVEANADAVKFQSFITEELITPDAPKANYQVQTTGETGSQYKMLKSLELSAEDQAKLKTYCEKVEIIYICTPYENYSVDILDKIGVTAFKIASTDTTNIPFLRYIASKQRPVILSTGMSNLAEVEQAVNSLQNGGLKNNFALLHCTSEYPAPINEVNLRAMLTLKTAFNCPVGFSDHTPKIGASPWAVAMGACIIEKHFTLDKNMSGPDHRASLEPNEFKELVETTRNVELAMGDGVKQPMSSEIPNKPMMQKSLVTKKAIKEGEIITVDDLVCKRPGVGISASWFDKIIGQKAKNDLPKDKILQLSDFDWN